MMSKKLNYHGTLTSENVKLYDYGTMSICVSQSSETGLPGISLKADEHVHIVSFSNRNGQPYDDALITSLLPQLGMDPKTEIRMYPNLSGSSRRGLTRYYMQVQKNN